MYIFDILHRTLLRISPYRFLGQARICGFTVDFAGSPCYNTIVVNGGRASLPPAADYFQEELR